MYTIDRFQPSFTLFPISNNRTGYQPVNLPVILSVPYVRSQNGFGIEGSGITSLTFCIEEAPGASPVAGVQNQGLFVPAYERYRINVTTTQLFEIKIDPSAQNFYNLNNEQIDYSEVQDGDWMEVTLIRGPIGAYGNSKNGPKSRISFYHNTDYYDLSPFDIRTVDLPLGLYNFSWKCYYNQRLLSPEGEFICIDDSRQIPSRLSLAINHPGEVHQAMYRRTPSQYFSSNNLETDSTLAFYRPFADALQDIFDEQILLKGINWVDYIPSQYIPYLANLIGLDLPYFPTSTDDVRRSLLKNGRKLQQLKGSRRAIRELFEIFGFTIDLTNLWYSQDGQKFIAPGESLPEQYSDQTVTTSDIINTEPLVIDYRTPGFGRFEIPLLYRPTGNITIDAYVVEIGSTGENQLKQIILNLEQDLNYYATEQFVVINNYQKSEFHDEDIDSLYSSTVLVSQDQNGILNDYIGKPIINKIGVKYDRDSNTLFINLDHYFSFDRGEVLYLFATYTRKQINLPSELQDLRSNRFDINVLLFKDGEQPTSDLYDFLLEYLFKFKAFHSLLRKIIFVVEINDLYNVQDFCIGGAISQSGNSDLGNLQTIPPVIPNTYVEPGDTNFVCSAALLDRNFKAEDLKLRSRILSLLEEEHQAWKDLSGNYEIPENLLPIIESLSRVAIKNPAFGPCQLTDFGQDRVVRDDSLDLDHVSDTRSKLCDLTSNTSDYCYKGRVQQEVEVQRAVVLDELYRPTPCELMLGYGLYYETPLIQNSELSGNKGANLTDLKNLNRSWHDRNYVRIMGFPNPVLHYNDRSELDLNSLNNRYYATNRPSLEIVKDNLFMPGHRYLSLDKLENDFIHPDYDFRPWDSVFHLCPENQPDNLPDLNARIEIGTDGDEYLLFNNYELTYYSNGLIPDIPSLDDHSLSVLDPVKITHTIWSSQDPGYYWSQGPTLNTGKVYSISYDNVRYPLELFDVNKDTICFTDEVGPIFNSANGNCECLPNENVYTAQDLEDLETTGNVITNAPESIGGADYIDGYPAEYGYYDVNLARFDFLREKITGYDYSLYDFDLYDDPGGEIINYDHALALGLPLIGTDEYNRSLLFKLGSGVRLDRADRQYHYFKPFRLDCGCLRFECSDTGVTTYSESPLNRCSLDHFIQDGKYDFSPDQVELEQSLILDEEVGVDSILLDGTIPNLMSLVGYEPGEIPASGSYGYIDDYGIIYRFQFETFKDRVDLTLKVQDPRIPGQENTGEVVNFKVFRDGIETVERWIFQVSEVGYLIIAEGSTQRVARFQSTFGCGDEKFSNPFLFNLNYSVTDEVDFIIDSGEFGFGEEFGEEFGV